MRMRIIASRRRLALSASPRASVPPVGKVKTSSEAAKLQSFFNPLSSQLALRRKAVGEGGTRVAQRLVLILHASHALPYWRWLAPS